MELYISEELKIDFDFNPGEKGIRENGILMTPDIPDSVDITGISIFGKDLSQTTRTALLIETDGKIEKMCMEAVVDGE